MAEAGLAALWLAAALSLLQLGFGIAALNSSPAFAGEGDQAKPGGGVLPEPEEPLHRTSCGPPPPEMRGRNIARAVRTVAVVQGLLVGLSFLLLIQLFLRTDLSVKLVTANSHSLKPWLYKFAGAWGNHEGSMLLWVTVLALAGAAVAVLERRLPERTLIATLAAQAAIGLGFYAFLLFSSNPFERVNPAPPEGNGSIPAPGPRPRLPSADPLFRYVGISIAFSFAVGALVTRDVGPVFARAMRPWIFARLDLPHHRITAGSYWAYYELGWAAGGSGTRRERLAHCPARATALLHSVTVLGHARRPSRLTIMLAVVAFSMSMIGTFLVRSGILTSVHAFAVDPERGLSSSSCSPSTSAARSPCSACASAP
jgi:cytochrome c-type biogenesis protein CcmF